MLPYVEQQAYYQLWDETKLYDVHLESTTKRAIAPYFCPTRRRPSEAFSNDVPSGGLSDYAACSGTGTNDGVGADGQINGNGAMIGAKWAQNSAGTLLVLSQPIIRLAMITDGTTNTFLLGEKHVRWLNAAGTARFVWGTADDRSVYTSGNANNYRRFAGLGSDGQAYTIATYVQSASIQATDNRKFGSRHPSVCQFTYCDGSVKAVSTNVDVTPLSRLAQKDDGFAIGDY
jgi:hypothetical protein